MRKRCPFFVASQKVRKRRFKMIYEKQHDLLDLKKRAGITNREIAAALGCSPSAAGAKLTGFVALFPEDRRIIEQICRNIIEQKNVADELQCSKK